MKWFYNTLHRFRVDYSTLDDLKPPQRGLYMQNVLPLTHAGSRFLLYGFEWQPSWYERPFYSSMALALGEAERRFSPHFTVERYAGETGLKGFPRG